jgi:pyrroloquinoline-quinone synthase
MLDAITFLAKLRKEIERHPAVNHPLLGRVAQVPFTREDYKIFGMQHFPLVGMFTTYMELLLLNAPDSSAKSWLAKVLVDEYGEGSDGKDHAECYREWLDACGVVKDEEWGNYLHEGVVGFMLEHFRICHEEPFLVGLGALGPGHEWSIPKMFPPIVRGLRRAGFTEDNIMYFTLHVEQDIDHGLWLEEALRGYCDDPICQAQVRRGAMLSLKARAKFWSGVQDKIVRWRQPENIHLRSQAHPDGHNGYGEKTFRFWSDHLKKIKYPSLNAVA